MKSPLISVVIPTYNRPTHLRECLTALQKQTLAQDLYEVVVVDDGSQSDYAVAREMGQQIPNLRWFTQAHGGAGAARNRGIREAYGGLILFVDDDVRPSVTLLEEHQSAHQRYPEDRAVFMGSVLWDPARPISSLMQWIQDSAIGSLPQEGICPIDPGCFFTWNLSIKKAFLIATGLFDEGMEGAGLEDMELGFRLARAGMAFYALPSARAVHCGPVTKKEFSAKRMIFGKNARYMACKIPDFFKNRALLPRYSVLRAVVAHLFWQLPFSVLGALPRNWQNQIFWHIEQLYYRRGFYAIDSESSPRSRVGRIIKRCCPSGIWNRIQTMRPLHSVLRYGPVIDLLEKYGAASQANPRILEVGSGSIGLGQLIPYPFTACDTHFDPPMPSNMNPVIASAVQLPFADHSFDVVVSVDTLEHIPTDENRLLAVREMLRVSSKVLIVGYPCGQKALEADRCLVEEYRSRHQDVPVWLKEHLENGLPSEHLLQAIEGLQEASIPNESVALHSWIMKKDLDPFWHFLFALSQLPGIAAWRCLTRWISSRTRHPYRRFYVLLKDASFGDVIDKQATCRAT